MSKIVEQARAMAKQVRFEDSELIPNTDVFKESADLIDALVVEVEKLEKDAARYRFVRQADGFLLDRIADMSTDGTEFDDAIDAAMEATK